MQLEIVEHDAGTFLFHIQLIVTITQKDWNVDQKCVWKSDNIHFYKYMYILYKLWSIFRFKNDPVQSILPPVLWS